jgi:hypothetical protein
LSRLALRLLAGLGSALVASPPAVADGVTSRAARAWGVVAHLGVGTPLGQLGLAIEHSPLPLFAIEAGLGVGDEITGDDDALNLALWPRLRLPLGRVALTAGGAFSVARHVHHSLTYPSFEKRWQPALRASLDGGIEVRLWRIELRLFAGRMWVLNAESADCYAPPGVICSREAGTAWSYGGLAFGVLF